MLFDHVFPYVLGWEHPFISKYFNNVAKVILIEKFEGFSDEASYS